jgi:hypothetical protein
VRCSPLTNIIIFICFTLKGEEYELTDPEGRRLFGLSVYERALLTPDEYYNLHLFHLKGEEYELTDPEGRRLFGLSVYERALLTPDEYYNLHLFHLK